MAAAAFVGQKTGVGGSNPSGDSGGGGGGGGGGSSHITTEVFSSVILHAGAEFSSGKENETRQLTQPQIQQVRSDLKQFTGSPLLLLANKVPWRVFVLCLGEKQMTKSVDLLGQSPPFTGSLSAAVLGCTVEEGTETTQKCKKQLNAKLKKEIGTIETQIKELEQLIQYRNQYRKKEVEHPRPHSRSIVDDLRMKFSFNKMRHDMETVSFMERAEIPLRLLSSSLPIFFSDIAQMNVEVCEDLIRRLEKSEELLISRNNWMICNFPFYFPESKEFIKPMFESFLEVVTIFSMDFMRILIKHAPLLGVNIERTTEAAKDELAVLYHVMGEKLKEKEEQFYQEKHMSDKPQSHEPKLWLQELPNRLFGKMAAVDLLKRDSLERTITTWLERVQTLKDQEFNMMSRLFSASKIYQLNDTFIAVAKQGFRIADRELNPDAERELRAAMTEAFPPFIRQAKEDTDQTIQVVSKLRTTLRKICALKQALEVCDPMQVGAGSAAAAAAASVDAMAASSAVGSCSLFEMTDSSRTMSPASSPAPVAAAASAPSAGSAAAAEPSAAMYLYRLAKERHEVAFGGAKSPLTEFQQNGWLALAIAASAVALLENTQLENTQSGRAKRRVLIGAALDSCHRYFEQAAPIKDPNLGHSLEVRYGGVVPVHLRQLRGMEMIGRYPYSTHGRGEPYCTFANVLRGKREADDEVMQRLTVLLREVFQQGDLQLHSSKAAQGEDKPGEIVQLKKIVQFCRQTIEEIPGKLVTANTGCLADALYHLEALDSTLTMMHQHPQPQYELLYLSLIHSSVEHVLELVGEAVYGKRTHEKIIAELVKNPEIKKSLVKFNMQRGIRYVYDTRYHQEDFRNAMNRAKGQFLSPQPFDLSTRFSKKAKKEAEEGLKLLQHIFEVLDKTLIQSTVIERMLSGCVVPVRRP